MAWRDLVRSHDGAVMGGRYLSEQCLERQQGNASHAGAAEGFRSAAAVLFLVSGVAAIMRPGFRVAHGHGAFCDRLRLVHRCIDGATASLQGLEGQCQDQCQNQKSHRFQGPVGSAKVQLY